MHKKLYDALGVKPNAPPSEIKRAYRQKAKAAHPDTGGSEDEFNKINHAYLVLISDDSRTKYDATGDENLKSASNDEAEVLRAIAEALESIISQLENYGKNPLEYDIIDMMKQVFVGKIGEIDGNIAKAEQFIAKTKRFMGRFTVKKGNNFIELMLRSKVDNITLNIINMKKQKIPFERALEMIKNVSFNKDAPAMQEFLTMRFL